MMAEILVHPDRAKEIRASYGISSFAAERAEKEWWARVVHSSPEIEKKWRALVEHYVAKIKQKGAP